MCSKSNLSPKVAAKKSSPWAREWDEGFIWLHQTGGRGAGNILSLLASLVRRPRYRFLYPIVADRPRKTLSFLDLRVGNDVEFSIEKRRDKEVAVNVSLLPDGSVIFDDISSQLYNGTITSLPAKPKKNETFSGDRSGRIETKIDGKSTTLPYQDRYVLSIFEAKNAQK